MDLSHFPKIRDESQTKDFVPLSLSLKEIRENMPPQLFQRNTLLSLAYLARDFCLAVLFFLIATVGDSVITSLHLGPILHAGLHWLLWALYWWFQGLVFTGLWTIGHECGHGAFSSNKTLCDAIGFILHTFLLTPYWSWKYVHHRHHANHSSIEHDEVYVPHTRNELKLPDSAHDGLEDLLGDTPIYTLFMLIRQQFLGFPAYLVCNVSGQRRYPRWSNHLNPNAIMFKKEQRWGIIISDIALVSMGLILYRLSNAYGVKSVFVFYGIPWIAVNHWFIMITYLHHTDPELPHYRGTSWSFQRGAAATMDRNFLGWQGRFFLHDVAHYHVVHHFFPMMPWYNGELATKFLREMLGSHYHYSSQPAFKALWHNYNVCQFVDDEGEIVFYRDRTGKFAQPL
ncbi:hypothetical protein K435DRAFT_964428 [Dendrothele bispora CBS 962.96]|uniref:Fatty acid desaturase domain-containing protein n=1 Tax=Dendrothele bispora (strain CBS 962.96) TaxID=1314807 RepID=A0A4S8MAF1_DENBC|nr:hypothetical protein K435DRAFT_964428 [Dendrothele bispora CBS 962.96]